MEVKSITKLIALIPSYEPDDKLISLVKELKEKEFTSIVVNDGSNDKYNNIFNEVKNYAHIISYNKNMGKGYALKKGFEYIKEEFKDYIVVTIDSDGQHKVFDAYKLCMYSHNHKGVLVLGKRIQNKNSPIRSRIGNYITRKVFLLTTGLNIYDTQTGLRSFDESLTDYMLSLDGNRYEYEMNMLLNLKKNNIDYKEIEIDTIYIENNSSSHFNVLKDSFKIYKEIFKFSCSSLISFLIDYILFIIFSFIFNITLSNILARIISATFNYNINKNIVFKRSNNSLIKYILLAISILIINTLLLNLFVSVGINRMLSKIICEITLFILSYFIQRIFVFGGDNY